MCGNLRQRHDGRHRSPWNEPECGPARQPFFCSLPFPFPRSLLLLPHGGQNAAQFDVRVPVLTWGGGGGGGAGQVRAAVQPGDGPLEHL